jgi:hypothetical protein
LAPAKGEIMSVRIEIRDEKGQSISVTNLNTGDSLSYPLIPRKLFTEELLVVFPEGSFNRVTRSSVGPIKGAWNGVYDTLKKGDSTEFTVPPRHRLIIKNI